ncbi:MAG: hypothetical protein K2X55_28910, partial [Burkholderiaceae bacterium]|nr:hypothetical protein [Burkholderiaceae bacterium]
IMGHFVAFKKRTAVMRLTNEHILTKKHFFEQVMHHCAAFKTWNNPAGPGHPAGPPNHWDSLTKVDSTPR